MGTYLFIAVVIAIAIWGIIIYNNLVRDKNTTLAAWSDIDVQLSSSFGGSGSSGGGGGGGGW